VSVLALLMHLLHCDDYACAKRLYPVATAIVAATPRSEEQAWLATQGKLESNFYDWVTYDAPKCRDSRDPNVCDSGRAWSPWQLWHTDRTGGVARAARLALSRWRFALEYCGTPEGAFALLATGHKCVWSQAPKRAAALASNLGRLTQ
jgi:hypothetical protein